MEYTLYQLLWLFLIYSFAGWCLEVCAAAARRRRFVNIGYLNSPFCTIYGLSAAAFALFLPELTGRPLFLFLGGMIIASFLEYVSGVLLERIFGRKWWDYSGRKWNIGGYVCLFNSVLWGIGAVVSMKWLNPFFIALLSLIPAAAGRILLWILFSLLVLDAAGSSAAVLQMHHRLGPVARQVREDMQKLSDSLGNALTRRIQQRMIHAYPSLTLEDLLRQRALREQEKARRKASARVFAEGCSFYKLASLFFIGSLLGDLVETVFCYVTAGVWMSRSSLVYGPFSIVWGFGCVLLTAFLYPYREKNDRYIFLAGTVLGGAYEYICSVLSELVFGTVFWDYSHIPFNLGGRINLLYCFFWGIVAVIWLKGIYPLLSGLIEKIPVRAGTIGCRIMLVFMIFNMALSALALGRYSQRQLAGSAQVQTTALGGFLDEHFPDERMERIYPNAKIVRE